MPNLHRQKTIDRMHLIVRLELGNPLLNTSDLAKLIGVTQSSYLRIRSLPLYKQIHNQYFSGVVTRLDKKVDDKLTLTKETLEFAVPMAMQALLKQALQEKDLRVQNKAANDILDRHGRFAKVTRVGLATPEQGGAADTKDNETAQELLKALQNATKPTAPSISDPPATTITQ